MSDKGLNIVIWVLGIAALFTLVVGFTIVMFPAILYRLDDSEIWLGGKFKFEELALVGDYYGGMLSAYFSLAGVFLFAATLLLQNKELSLQRKEFSKSVSAQEDSAKEIATQNKGNVIKAQIDARLVLIQADMELAKIKRGTPGGQEAQNKYEEHLKEVTSLISLLNSTLDEDVREEAARIQEEQKEKVT